MAQYKVTGTVNVNVEIIVEADSEAQAIDRAEDELPELDYFYINDRTDQVVGTELAEATLDASDVVVYTKAEVV